MKLCECGCGAPAPFAKATSRRKGHVKGEPTRFISGHNNRGKAKSPETRARMSSYALNRASEHHAKLIAKRRSRPLPSELPSVNTIHSWLNRHYPRAGVCECCGATRKTDYSFKHHPQPHTRDRSDYAELCRSCHVRFDLKNGMRRQPGKTPAADLEWSHA